MEGDFRPAFQGASCASLHVAPRARGARGGVGVGAGAARGRHDPRRGAPRCVPRGSAALSRVSPGTVSAGASPLAACEASGQASSKGRRLAGALGGARSLGARPQALPHPWELHGTSRLVTRALSAAVARESIGSLERIS